MKNLIPFFVILPNLIFSQITDSTFVYQMAERDIAACQLIVEGKVLASSSYFNADSTFIYTSNTVRVEEVLKEGQIALQVRSNIEVITDGGVVGEHTGSVSHGLTLSAGDHGVFLLIPSDVPHNPSSKTPAQYHFRVFDDVFFQYLDHSTPERGPVLFLSGNAFTREWIWKEIDKS